MSGINLKPGDDIKAKLELLLDRMKHLKEQRDVLLQESARLAETLEQTRKELNDEKSRKEALTVQLNALQDPESVDQEEGKRTEIREKIKELADEIDKCIMLLNNA